MSTASVAKSLRQALKSELGLGPREVSVRTHSYSLGSSIDVTIKVPGILLARVEEVADRFERIDRDPASGEILCGGNIFVRVSYDHSVLAGWLEKYGPRLPEDGGEATIAPGLVVRRDGDWYRFWRGAVQVRFCCDKRLASIHWAQLELEEADAGVAGALRALHRLSQECELAEIAHGHIGEALRLLELGDLFGAAQFAGRADWATFGERGPVRAAVEQAIEDLRERCEAAKFAA